MPAAQGACAAGWQGDTCTHAGRAPHIEQDGVCKHVADGDAQRLQAQRQGCAAGHSHAERTHGDAPTPWQPREGHQGAAAAPPTSAIGWMTKRKPPDTKNTCLPCSRSTRTNSGMPGEICGRQQAAGRAMHACVRERAAAAGVHGRQHAAEPGWQHAAQRGAARRSAPWAGAPPGTAACRLLRGASHPGAPPARPGTARYRPWPCGAGSGAAARRSDLPSCAPAALWLAARQGAQAGTAARHPTAAPPAHFAVSAATCSPTPRNSAISSIDSSAQLHGCFNRWAGGQAGGRLQPVGRACACTAAGPWTAARRPAHCTAARFRTHNVLSTSKVKASALRSTSATSGSSCSRTPARDASAMAPRMRSSCSAHGAGWGMRWLHGRWPRLAARQPVHGLPSSDSSIVGMDAPGWSTTLCRRCRRAATCLCASDQLQPVWWRPLPPAGRCLPGAAAALLLESRLRGVAVGMARETGAAALCTKADCMAEGRNGACSTWGCQAWLRVKRVAQSAIGGASYARLAAHRPSGGRNSLVAPQMRLQGADRLVLMLPRDR